VKQREPLELKLPGESQKDRRALIAAIILHALFIVVLSTLVAVPMLNILRGKSIEPPVPERVTYLQTQTAPPPKPPASKDTSSRREEKQPPSETKREEPPVTTVPPPVTEPPKTPPAEPPSTVTTIQPGRGGDSSDKRIVGRGGIKGLSPGVADPRLYGGDGPDSAFIKLYGGDGRNPAAVVRSWSQTYWDSVAMAQLRAEGNRPDLDWTVARNGKKYGIDPQYVYFGKFKVPTMLLALLPINLQANPSAYERRKALESMQREIEFQSYRSASQEDFTRWIKELRERKEKERAAAAKK
jgi:hypothetical protein